MNLQKIEKKWLQVKYERRRSLVLHYMKLRDNSLSLSDEGMNQNKIKNSLKELKKINKELRKRV